MAILPKGLRAQLQSIAPPPPPESKPAEEHAFAKAVVDASQRNAEAMAKVAEKLGEQKPSAPVPYRFKVIRDGNGLIESVIATPEIV